MKHLPEIDRFCAKFRCLPNGCWEWVAARHIAGYGAFGKTYAHRESYRIFIGPIPCGKNLHHKCENKWCVNPHHLEPITRKEHYGDRHFDKILEIAHKRRGATHCHRGHGFTPDNTGWNKQGMRWCKECHNKRCADRRLRMRAHFPV